MDELKTVVLNGFKADEVAEMVGGVVLYENTSDDMATIAGGDWSEVSLATMYKIYYKGEPTNYPLYDSEKEAVSSLKEEGLTDEELEDTWPSPLGVCTKIEIKPVEVVTGKER